MEDLAREIDEIAAKWIKEMLRPPSDAQKERYGLGFWLDASSEAVILEGMDAGVSFRSRHEARSGLTYTVISNTTDGAWPIVRHLAGRLSE